VTNPVVSYVVWSPLQGEIGSVKGIRLSSLSRRVILTTTPPRLVVYCLDKADRNSIGLFDYKTGERLKDFLIDAQGDFSGAVHVDEDRGVLLTVEVAGDKQVLKKWKLADGEFMKQRDLGEKLPRKSITFVRYGKCILAPAGARGGLDIIDVDTFGSFLPSGASSVDLFSLRPLTVAWQEEDKAQVWDLRENVSARRSLRGLDLKTLRGFAVRADGSRLASLHQNGKLELRDAKTGNVIKILVPETSGTAENDHVQDSLTGTCLCESSAPGRVRLYDWDSGKLLADLGDVGGRDRIIHYDPQSRQVYVWSNRGDCVKYTQWRRTLGDVWLWRAGSDH
jgi:WD40 repeat protein